MRSGERRGLATPPLARRLRLCLACEAFGPEHFLVLRPDKWHPNGRRALELIDDLYTQDGPDILPASNERFVLAHLMTRYYGPGYERGDLPFLIALAEWLERKLKPCEVWYGGDSSGVCAEPFGAKERAAMLDHLASANGRDYFRQTGMLSAGESAECDFCEAPMNAQLFSNIKTGFECAGCGLRTMVHRDGKIESEVGKWPGDK